jgi:hypothetical protein
MNADEVSGWLGELLQLSKVENRSDIEKERVGELCRLLRGAGYASQWLEDFTEGKLRLGNIKRWTKGVEVSDVSGKDELMGELRSFVESGHRVSDLSGYADAKKALESLPMTFVQCAGFVGNLMKLEANPQELLLLSKELAETGLTAKGISRTNVLRKSLDGKGIKIEVEEEIFKAANMHGSGEGVLNAIAATEDLRFIVAQTMDQKKESKRYAEEIVSQKSELNNLIHETISYKGTVDVAKTLMGRGFDQNACNELLKATEKYGSAPATIGAVNRYNDVKEINVEIEGKKAEYNSWDAGVNKLQKVNASLLNQNAEANQLLGKIEEKYNHSKHLHDIASIVTDPQGARIPGPALARIGVSFLTGFMMCAEASPDQNRKLITAAKSNIDYTVANINNYLRGT